MTSKMCCACKCELENYKDKKGKKIHRLLVCKSQVCVSSQNKKVVYKTRDLNSAVNILNLTRMWLERKDRPIEFCRKSRSSPSVSTHEDKVEP
jgi:hypothetical protein